MRRTLFAWRGIQVYSYPALFYVGTVLGMVASNYAANVAGLNSARVFVAQLLLTIPALVGARLLFVVTHWERYRGQLGRILRRVEGGGSMQGGLLLLLAVSWPLLRALRLPLAPFFDVSTFTMLVAMVFARIGCALNGCCSGRPSNGLVSLCLPNHRGRWQRRVPTQFLEAGLALLLLLAAGMLWGRRPFEGAIFLIALAGYSMGRLILQPLREEQERFGGVNVQQALPAALAVAAIALYVTGLPGAH